MSFLPKYVGFQNHTERKYLQYLTHGFFKGNLYFSSDQALTPFTKFEIEPDKNGKYWHIKCCYNNKYLASSNDYNRFVRPFVSKPSENDTSWPCTLFNIIQGPTVGTYYLFDVLLQTYACRCTSCKNHPNVLTTRYKQDEKHHGDKLLLLVDFENIIRLPKYVTFKNGDKFLAAYPYNYTTYLQFNAHDVGDPRVSQEVFNVGDGTIRIKNESTKMFWRRDPNWIKADSDDQTENDKNTLFWPIKIAKNKVALRNVANGMFCRNLSADGKSNFLNSNIDSITQDAELEIVDPIISREIYNIQYRTMDARKYDAQVLTMAAEEAINTSPKEAIMTVSLRYQEEKSKTWESSLTIGVGIETSIKAGVPSLFETEIKVNYTFEGSYKWGETIQESKEVTGTYTVIVPPNTKMKVTLLATKAKCDIPFSYTQRDLLRNGRKVERVCDDGLYTGVYTFNFNYQSKSLPL
uniref:Agglutinin domain-containing protein n=1 Tax=Cucumis sativus TaxID=3659 RepID=A0A0A0K970_CUCSA